MPVFRRTVAYKPNVQTIFDKNLLVSGVLNDWAYTQASQLTTVMGVPFTLDGLPPHASTPEAQVLTLALDDPGPIQTSISVGDLTTHLANVQNAILLRPMTQWTIDRNARINILRNQGIVAGMEAYDNEMRIYDWRWSDIQNKAFLDAQQEQTRIVQLNVIEGRFANDAQNQRSQQQVMRTGFLNQAALQKFEMLRTIADFIEVFRARSMQEQLTARQEPLNELTSLLHGGQVAQPQFEQFRPGHLDPTPVGQYVYQSAQLDMQRYQVQAQQSQSMMGGMFGLAGNLLGGLFAMSDARVKTDVVRLGTDKRGFGWYGFRYLGEHPLAAHIGVMAQEVMRFMPSAVVRRPSGLLLVDYGKVING